MKTSREIVDAAYEAVLGRGDIDDFLIDFADDAEMVEPVSLPYGGTYRGPAAIKAAIVNVFNYWTDFSYSIDHIVGEETCIMVYGHFKATSISTGRSVNMPLVEVWLISDGKVRTVLPIYSDTKLAVDALGCLSST